MKSKTVVQSYRTHSTAAVPIAHMNNQQNGRLNDFKRQIRSRKWFEFNDIFELSRVHCTVDCIRTKYDNLLHGVNSWLQFCSYVFHFIFISISNCITLFSNDVCWRGVHTRLLGWKNVKIKFHAWSVVGFELTVLWRLEEWLVNREGHVITMSGMSVFV